MVRDTPQNDQIQRVLGVGVVLVISSMLLMSSLAVGALINAGGAGGPLADSPIVAEDGSPTGGDEFQGDCTYDMTISGGDTFQTCGGEDNDPDDAEEDNPTYPIV